MAEAVHVTSMDPPVRGFLHVPGSASGDGVILTHGAGANCGSPLLTRLAEAFCETGLTVLRCDLPFRQQRAYGPPMRGMAERDQQGLKRAVEWMRTQVAGRVFLGGHSYGGRQASMLAADEPAIVDGLLLLSYPLHPPNKPTQLRTGHFPHLQTPALFVSGAKDEFATPEELMQALKLIPTHIEFVSIPGVGHPLLPKRNAEETLATITRAFCKMLVQR